uniref:Glycosyltransferase 61 catalytic domain-containing protein n=1 Tax=Compsopogon caeruleus TaxID=31354 RepID=A0A7S1XFB8_9RHOD|mmetsp:Transcript_2566/g.4531  ORF Transcript_2566/g.4531 Transcript_2566/m.4531 type:complete len:571 (+) Transcript_2566:255-1967(+)
MRKCKGKIRVKATMGSEGRSMASEVSSRMSGAAPPGTSWSAQDRRGFGVPVSSRTGRLGWVKTICEQKDLRRVVLGALLVTVTWICARLALMDADGYIQFGHISVPKSPSLTTLSQASSSVPPLDTGPRRVDHAATTQGAMESARFDSSKLKGGSLVEPWAMQCHATRPRYERFCFAAPFCIDGPDRYLHKQGDVWCGQGEEGSVQWRGSFCDSFVEKLFQEADFPGKSVARPGAELDSFAHIEGVTVFFRLKPSAGNIAHFAGRMLFLQFLLSHPEALGHREISRVVALVPDQVLPKLRDESSWQRGFMEILMSGQISEAASLDMVSSSSTGFVFVRELAPTNRICLAWAVLPAFLKGRFFASTEPVSGNEKVNLVVPKSADDFRSRVYQWLGKPPPKTREKMVYLARTGRRSFTSSSEQLIMSTLRNFCVARGLELVVANIDSTTSIEDQILIMYDAALAIGIHGANLVNLLFLPARSAIIEIFPFGFEHNMYENGANAGIFYSRYQIHQGVEFPELAKYNGSRYICVTKNIACKLFYRSDHRQIEFDEVDAAGLLRTLESSLATVVG